MLKSTLCCPWCTNCFITNVLQSCMCDQQFCVCVFIQEKQARIASLYLPLYGLILDNMPRFFLRDLFPIYLNSSDQVKHTHMVRSMEKPCCFWLLTLKYSKNNQCSGSIFGTDIVFKGPEHSPLFLIYDHSVFQQKSSPEASFIKNCIEQF